MTVHRRNRDGKIWQRASDGRWCARVYPPVEIGGRSRLVYGRTWDEADAKRNALEAELSQGLPGEKDQPLEQWMRHWLDEILTSRVATRDLAQSTLNSYRDNAVRHIIPDLGPVPLRKLSVSRVRTWMRDLTRKPSGRARKKLRRGETELPPQQTLSLRTVAYCHAILRAALSDAVRDELLTRNVAALVEPPPAGREELTPVTKDEMTRLLAATGGDPLWCYWVTVLSLGLRRGEALAIRWSDVDFDARTVKVTGSIQRISQDGVSKLVRKATKTPGSKALMACGPGLMAALAERQREQRKIRMKSKAWLDTDLVFTTSVGSALEPRNVNRAWDAICDRAGVRATIHDLRHACGTYLGAEGESQKTISSVLRHTRMATTEIYVHALEEVSRSAIERLDETVTSLRKAAGTLR